jgi:Flp pilus assembly protein TadG
MRARVRCRPSRRGNYAILFVLMIPVILGFGALAVDVSFMRLVQSQTQDVADAASQAALLVLRRTGGNQAAAEAAAAQVVGLNVIGGAPGDIADIQFGEWDSNLATPVFVPTNVRPNAVRVQVARSDENAAPLFLARIWGYEAFDTVRSATSASREMHVVLSIDITSSWSAANFSNAQAAALRFYDTLAGAHGPDDMFGINVWLNRWGYEWMPLFELSNTASRTAARTMIVGTGGSAYGLRPGSASGNGNTFPSNCTFTVHSSQLNQFNAGVSIKRSNGSLYNPQRYTLLNGCYPDMPRRYNDETGTNHMVGLVMSRMMFDLYPDPTAFRALVMLTDGLPTTTSTSVGNQRAAAGYVENRWRIYQVPGGVTQAQVQSGTPTLAAQMWQDHRTHTWMVSFNADAQFLRNSVQGQGYYINTTSSAGLIPIFEDIANSLPMAIVE